MALGAIVTIAIAGTTGSEEIDWTRPVPSTAAEPSIPQVEPVRRPPDTREVVVRGRVTHALGDVRIVLEWADGSRIASAPVDPTGFGHGDWIPFETRFRLRTPPPGGAWPSFIVAVDGAGRTIDATRYPFTVRSYVYIPASRGPAIARPASSDGRPTLGEDGVMGGIPFGTNFLRKP